MNILLCYEFHKQGEDYSRGYDIYLVLIITVKMIMLQEVCSKVFL